MFFFTIIALVFIPYQESLCQRIEVAYCFDFFESFVILEYVSYDCVKLLSNTQMEGKCSKFWFKFQIVKKMEFIKTGILKNGIGEFICGFRVSASFGAIIIVVETLIEKL